MASTFQTPWSIPIQQGIPPAVVVREHGPKCNLPVVLHAWRAVRGQLRWGNVLERAPLCGEKVLSNLIDTV